MPANLPQRPGMVGQRTGLAALERRREREADIRPAVVVAAYGREFLQVRDVADDTEYVVSNPTGKTFAPQSRVFLGSNTGHQPEFVIAGPPSNFGGSSAFAAIPYSTPLPAEPVTVDHVAFFLDGAELTSVWYSQGTPGATRASVGEVLSNFAGNFGGAAFIRTDAGAAVSDYSLAYATGAEVKCYDPTTDTLYTHTPADSYIPSGVGYVGGWLYWHEREAAEHGTPGAYGIYVRLMKARCDLTTGLSTVATYEVTYVNTKTWNSLGILQRTAPTAVISQWGWQQGETFGYTRVRTTLTATDTHDDDSNNVTPAGVPGPTGSYVYSTDDTAVASVTDSVTATYVALWPGTSAWPGNLALDYDATSGLLSGYGEMGSDYGIVRHGVTGPFTTPASTITVTAHETLGTPDLFYPLT